MISFSALPDLNVTQALRQQFPAIANKAYFNFGGQGPMPQSALDALYQAHHHTQLVGPFSSQINSWIRAEASQLRTVLAKELGIPATSLTLTENVTAGCNIPLWGMEWQTGDEILMSDCEHPGVVAAIQEISRRFGVAVQQFSLVNWQGEDEELVAAIAGCLTPRTRLLVISHLLWNTGQILPLKAIANLCHNQPQPVWVLVDAAQSVGSMPLNLTDLEADFYAFTGHKWLCGAAGLGGLYVRPDVMEQIAPTYVGWRSITMDGAGNPTGWKPSAERFEVATSDYALMPALRSAIATHHHWGTAVQRYQRICQLSQYLWQKLSVVPQLRCLCQTPPPSGLVSFQVMEAGQPSPQRQRQLVTALEERGFLLRTLLFPDCIRACVHYFTLESELDRLVAEMQTLLGQNLSQTR